VRDLRTSVLAGDYLHRRETGKRSAAGTSVRCKAWLGVNGPL